ncbi:hypothetical protein F5884DRAFT_849816 [Xylogone sp. PMI_703]|nr:hypothetical protein F5884DRAFT_849816 [Xylogone sp. PMI_703]
MSDPSGRGVFGETNNGGGLDNLLAQLRGQQNRPTSSSLSFSSSGFVGDGTTQQQQQQSLPHSYQQPSVSTPNLTPPSFGAQPHHRSAVISPNVETPQPRLPSGNTSNLLNLLKFQPASSSPTTHAPIGTPLPPSRDSSVVFGTRDPVLRQSSGSGRTGSDLLAQLMGTSSSKPTSQANDPFNPTSQEAHASFKQPASPSSNPQALLLSLLNQPKPAQNDTAIPEVQQTINHQPITQEEAHGGPAEQSVSPAPEPRDLNLMDVAATEGKLETPLGRAPAPAPAPAPQPKEEAPKPMFTYVNPFDQLAASSPRNRTPKAAAQSSFAPPAQPSTAAHPIQILKNPRQSAPETTDHKRNVSEAGSISSPTKSKLVASQTSSPVPSPLPDGRTQIEALIGIGAPHKKDSVPEAVGIVGEQVHHEVQQMIAEAEAQPVKKEPSVEEDLLALLTAQQSKKGAEAAAHRSTSPAKKELEKESEKEKNIPVLEKVPSPAVDVERNAEDSAAGHVIDSWESADADDSAGKEDSKAIVKVYNFPMKPWTVITIKGNEEALPVFSDDVVLDIARLKKDFDQIDRTLATASNNFIVYGMSKNGGVRIIRQENGSDTKVFTETQDRVFNVSISWSEADQKETIIATGISGTVYWATTKDGEGDNMEDGSPEKHGFALPPINTQDSESPGGVLKTRARKSSRHPEFFAVGRGKSIHIIWPSVILHQGFLKGKERIVDTEKYLAHQSLKVNTGKAGKDFTFSEDDTTIVSLDKAGRVKFWDVRELTSSDDVLMAKFSKQSRPIEVKEPILTHSTNPAGSNEKSWPTSVLFVDKLRPYERGGAQRYLIVGMKQNHTLQLWDLGLGRPVQEIHLPHGKESDAVCSVMYHAATGIIVVGHPTRNSIYFLHLSAPKYTLPRAMTQAEYLKKIVEKDPKILTPESTAVISGMREYSFANKGVLRSLDILQTAASDDANVLFELYAMHSKGVTCLRIRRTDLGWNASNKVIEPLSAEEAGLITLSTMKDPREATEVVEQPLPAPPPIRIAQRPAQKDGSPRPTGKRASHTESTPAPSKSEDKPEKKESPVLNGSQAASGAEKSDKKKRQRKTTSAEASNANTAAKNSAAENAVVKNGTSTKAAAATSSEATPITSHTSEDSIKDINSIQLTAEIQKVFNKALDALYQNIKDDRRTLLAVADTKQEAMLRLVSSTLSDNVEATLGRIVSNSIQQTVLPAIIDASSKAITDGVQKTVTDIISREQLGVKFNTQISHLLPREIQKILPDIVGKTVQQSLQQALQQPNLVKLISDSVVKTVTFRVEEEFNSVLQKNIAPTFTNLAVQAAKAAAVDIQRQTQEQIGAIERQRNADSAKIEQLTQLVTGLSEIVSSMAAAQTDFQDIFLKQQAVNRQEQLSQQSGQSAQAHGVSGETPRTASRPSTGLPLTPAKTAEQLEFERTLAACNEDMNNGDYESAMVRWLQNGSEQELWTQFFSKFNPNFIRDLSPLTLLGIGAVVSKEFDDNKVLERLGWLETVISSLLDLAQNGQMDNTVMQHVPKIIGVYIQRLESLFMRISIISAQEPILKRIANSVNTCKRIVEVTRTRYSQQPSYGGPSGSYAAH